MISCRDYALKVIEYRDRTEKELREKLKEKGFGENLIDDELEFLKSYGFINDARYAERFTADAINLKKWGKSRIKSELIRKGVDRELIDNTIEDAFLELDDDRLFSEMSLFWNVIKRN